MEQTFETPGRLQLELRIPAGSIRIRAEETSQTQLSITRGTEPRGLPDRVRRRSSGRAPSDGRVPGTRQAVRLAGHRAACGADGAARYRRRLRHGLGRPGDHGADRLADVPQRLRRLPVRRRRGRGHRQGRRAATWPAPRSAAASRSTRRRATRASARIGGDVTGKSASGDVSLGTIGGSVRLATVSGDVEIGSVATGSASVRSVSGDVEIGVARGTRVYLDINSTSGDTVSELDMSDAASSAAAPTWSCRSAR